MITRFGGAVADDECPACKHEFSLLARAGKIVDENGGVLIFHFADEANGDA